MEERGAAELHDRQFHSVSLLSGFGSVSSSLSLCISEYIIFYSYLTPSTAFQTRPGGSKRIPARRKAACSFPDGPHASTIVPKYPTPTQNNKVTGQLIRATISPDNQNSHNYSNTKIKELCAAPLEAINHSPSQMQLSCPVAPQASRSW